MSRVQSALLALSLVASIGTCLLNAPASRAAAYLVEPDGTGDFPTIQAAIDAAVDGDIVLLGSGTFRGPGNRDLSLRGKAISVRSAAADPELCTIDCQSNEISSHRGFLVNQGEGPTTTIEGIHIVSGSSSASSGFNWGGAIAVENSSPTIRNCIFENNQGFYGGALAFMGSSSVVEDIYLKQNHAIGAAIYATAGSNLQFERITAEACPDYAVTSGPSVTVNNSNATFTNCTFARCGGNGVIFASGGAQVSVVRSIIAFNRGLGSRCGSGSISLECCDVFGNVGGDWADCIASQENQNGNFSADPLFCVGHLHDLEVNASSPCLASTSPCGDIVGAWGVGCVTSGMGACCENGTGECLITTANLCAQGGDYLGDGTICDPNPCNMSGVPEAATRLNLELRSGNPTSDDLRFAVGLLEAGEVNVFLVAPNGTTVARLQEGWLPAGSHELRWDSRSAASGVYWLVAEAGGERRTTRVTLMR